MNAQPFLLMQALLGCVARATCTKHVTEQKCLCSPPMLENTQLLKTMSGSEGPPGSARRKPRGGSWRGDPGILAGILSAFATKPSFVQYSEDLGSPIDVAKLSAHAPLVNQLRELKPPLIFSQTSIMEALEIVREQRKFDLGGDDDVVVSD